jgi:hypothetical protein
MLSLLAGKAVDERVRRRVAMLQMAARVATHRVAYHMIDTAAACMAARGSCAQEILSGKQTVAAPLRATLQPRVVLFAQIACESCHAQYKGFAGSQVTLG